MSGACVICGKSTDPGSLGLVCKECLSKERTCIVCGSKVGPSDLLCEHCFERSEDK